MIGAKDNRRVLGLAAALQFLQDAAHRDVQSLDAVPILGELGTHLRQIVQHRRHDDLGWHPAATGLKALHDAGQLVAITGVDYPDPSMSHFESAHNWRTGSTDPQQNLGWLGRYLDVVGTGNPLEGIAVQWGGDGALQGRKAATATVHDPGDYGIWSPGVWNGDRMAAAWARMGAPAKSPAATRPTTPNCR